MINFSKISKDVEAFCKVAIEESVGKYYNYMLAVYNKYMEMISTAPSGLLEEKKHDEVLANARSYLLSEQNMKVFNYLRTNIHQLNADCRQKFKIIEYSVGSAKAFSPTIYQ